MNLPEIYSFYTVSSGENSRAKRSASKLFSLLDPIENPFPLLPPPPPRPPSAVFAFTHEPCSRSSVPFYFLVVVPMQDKTVGSWMSHRKTKWYIQVIHLRKLISRNLERGQASAVMHVRLQRRHAVQTQKPKK